jgi:hypothetical protein
MHRDDNYYMDINCFHSMYYLSKPSTSHRVLRIYTVAKAPYKNSAREMPISDQPNAKLESSLAVPYLMSFQRRLQSMVLSPVSPAMETAHRWVQEWTPPEQ